MTFCSTFVVALSLILVFFKNNVVEASFTRPETIEQMLYEVDNDEDFAMSVDESEAELKAEEEAKDAGPVRVEVKSGDTFLTILTGAGLSYKAANAVFMSSRKIFNPRDLRVGQVFEIETEKSGDDVKLKRLHSVLRIGEHLNIELNDKNAYSAKIVKDELVEELKAMSGTINGTLSVSMNKNGVPSRIVANFIKIFNGRVDFRRDLKKGDSYELMYENYITPEGKFAKHGDIMYAALHLGKNKIELYRFKNAKGSVDYFDAKGSAPKKTLMRRPMEHKSSRISSYFGRRRHPIYKDVRVHWGVDYPAPKGSKVYAAGDGVVEVAQYRRGYGNYIKIRHGNEYSTAYGHLNGYAKGIRSGVRVKQGQIIGYVGSSGRSTGPHLHYELLRYGKRVDPLTARATASEDLTGKDLANFKNQVAKINKTRSTMTAAVKKEEKLAQSSVAKK